MEALFEAYGYEKLEGQGRRVFDQWVASVKAHRSAMKAFQEFEHCFAQLSKRDQRSVGVDKVLLFFKSVHREERMDILLELKDDYGASNLTDDWTEVETVCR